MAIAPTRFSRVSLGYVDSVKTVVGADAGDTGDILSVNGNFGLYSSLKSMVVPSVTPITSTSTLVTLSGVTSGDVVLVAPATSLYSGDAVKLIVNPVVSRATADTVEVHFSTTSDTIAIVAANWRFTRVGQTS